MRLCLIRHGSTAWNEAGRIQGRRDVPLSDLGRDQVRRWQLPENVEACRVSPLRRATETAAILGFADAAPDARLVEMDWGAYEGRTLAELRADLGATLDDGERRGLDFRPQGGESPREVAARLAQVCRDLARDGRPHLMVAHKGILRAALVLSLGWDMRAKPPVRYDPERALVLDLAPDGGLVFRQSLPLRAEPS